MSTTPPFPVPPVPTPELLELPPLAELQAGAHVVSLPMRVKFRGVLQREVMLLHGPAGWAEFNPFTEYDAAESAPWLAGAIEAGWQGFPAPIRASVPVNATVPAVSAERVAGVLTRFGTLDGPDAAAGTGAAPAPDAAGTGVIPAVKVKVAEAGQSVAEDIARVAEVRRLLPGAALRVDANGGWDVPGAITALMALAEYGLEYAEQPVPTIAGLRAVRMELRRRGIPVLIAADESVRKESDPLLVAREDAADLIVVKAAPLGGVWRALRIVAQAGLPAVVSSALDSSVGIRAGVALAAALPQLPYACGLATVSLMAADVTEHSLRPDGGVLPVRDVKVSAELLARHAAPAGREQWWRQRLSQVYSLL